MCCMYESSVKIWMLLLSNQVCFFVVFFLQQWCTVLWFVIMRMINRGKGFFCSCHQTCFQTILFITHHACLVKPHYVALQQCLVALWPKRQNETLDTVGFKRCGRKVSQRFMESKQKKTIWPKTSYKNLKVHFIYIYLSRPLKVTATRQWCCLKIDNTGCHCFLNFERYISTFNRKTVCQEEK